MQGSLYHEVEMFMAINVTVFSNMHMFAGVLSSPPNSITGTENCIYMYHTFVGIKVYDFAKLWK